MAESPNGTQRDLGRLEGAVHSLSEQVSDLSAKMDEVRAYINQLKGASRTRQIMMNGGSGGIIAVVVSWGHAKGWW